MFNSCDLTGRTLSRDVINFPFYVDVLKENYFYNITCSFLIPEGYLLLAACMNHIEIYILCVCALCIAPKIIVVIS